jgi:hypothetical protein
MRMRARQGLGLLILEFPQQEQEDLQVHQLEEHQRGVRLQEDHLQLQ